MPMWRTGKRHIRAISGFCCLEMWEPASLGAGVVVTITLKQIDSTPHAETGTEGNNEGLEDFDSRVKEFHSRFSFINESCRPSVHT